MLLLKATIISSTDMKVSGKTADWKPCRNDQSMVESWKVCYGLDCFCLSLMNCHCNEDGVIFPRNDCETLCQQ